MHSGAVLPHGDVDEMQTHVARSCVLHTASGGHAPVHSKVNGPPHGGRLVVEVVDVVVGVAGAQRSFGARGVTRRLPN